MLLSAENGDENGNSQSVTEKGIKPVNEIPIMENREEPDSCSDPYIYVHNIPNQFNYDILESCSSPDVWTEMCRLMSNSGLGPPLANSERVFSNTGWFGNKTICIGGHLPQQDEAVQVLNQEFFRRFTNI
ncbi:hypothetical protein HHK36_019071 [Tetracentron sinense]|uniref:Uncharacterized protein n=1 Tax=Tetracentron sinense TaxID=13715 RepID=A0A834YX01_TETSI|nr:hypothetical protein HHK36_019071 [Tetracentron sinense]